MDNPTVVGFLLIVIGIVTMTGAVLNWRIVSHPGKIINRIFGDSIARIVYFVAGIFLFVVGVGRLINVSWF